MTAIDVFAAYVRRYPQWGDANASVTLTPDQIRKVIEQAYDAGHRHGFTNGKAAAEMAHEDAKADPIANLFGSMFGGKNR